MLIQEIFIFNTNKVNPTFLIQVVFTPVAEMNVCSWQNTHWSCSSDTTEIALTRSSHQYVQVHVHLATGDHTGCKKAISGKKENWAVAISLVDVQRHWMDWGCPRCGQKASKKTKKAISNENCVWAPRSRLGPKDLGNRKKTVASGNCVLLETGKFQTSSICTVGGMKKSGKYNSELLQEHLKTEFQSRTLPCTWEQDVSGFPVPGTVLQPRQPHFPRGRCIQPP